MKSIKPIKINKFNKHISGNQKSTQKHEGGNVDLLVRHDEAAALWLFQRSSNSIVVMVADLIIFLVVRASPSSGEDDDGDDNIAG